VAEVKAWAIKSGTGKLMPWTWKTKREVLEGYGELCSFPWAGAQRAGMRIVRVRIVEDTVTTTQSG